MTAIGKPLNRVDGLLKVTGQARYAGEFPEAGLLHGSVVSSTIAKGRVINIDASKALALPGCGGCYPSSQPPRKSPAMTTPLPMTMRRMARRLRPLYNDRALYSGQPLALVIADNLELARHAGSLVHIDYECEDFETDLLAQQELAYPSPQTPPKPRGNFQAEWSGAAISLDLHYSTPIEHHNPMEPHASTVLYQPDGTLHIHDKTQGPQNRQAYVQKSSAWIKVRCASLLRSSEGAFGSGLRPQYQLPLAVMASLALKRSVRVTLTRQQMFTFGYRPRTLQRLQMGAAANGRLLALGHTAIGQTSRFEDFSEHVVEWSGMPLSLRQRAA